MNPHPEFHKGMFRIYTDPARVDLGFVHAFLAIESYWAQGISRETLQRALAHSLCFSLYHGLSPIGFARAITDTATYAYLDDVFVLAEHRGQGLGGWLLECVLAHPDLQGLKRFGLATRDAQTFYGQHGWQPLRYPDRHLERLAPSFYPPPA
jgi:N-acetylglutamate synthase-like GNAT family acetyltransferase